MKKELIHFQASFTFVLVCILSLIPFTTHGAVTAEQVVQKAAAVVSNAKGITASFTMTFDGRPVKGTINSSGQKFSVKLPQVSTWYNGKALYTYNPRTRETTVVTPTAQELLESNPLLYVKGSAGSYFYSFSPVKRNGKFVVDVVPRSKKSGVKKMTFTINSSTYKIERIAVNTGNGNTTVDITSLKTDAVLSASEFEYPAASYPKVEIVDLR